MLDLLPEPDGFLDTLVTTLTHKHVSYTYFLRNTSYYEDLLSLLKDRRVPQNKLDRLRCVVITEPYVPPVVIYIHETRHIGFRGRERPSMRRLRDGSWQLVTPLDPAWSTILDREALTRHYAHLEEYATRPEDNVCTQS